MILIADLETNGLLDKLTTIHSLVLRDLETGDLVLSCAAASDGHPNIPDGLARINGDDVEGVWWHNGLGFDIPAIEKVYPSWRHGPTVRDSLITARMVWPTPDLRKSDMARVEQKRLSLPTRLYGSHSLDAWGHRLGNWKGDYAAEMKEKGLDPWAAWNPAMQDYCELDTGVTRDLVLKINEQSFSSESINLEHDFQELMDRQQKFGLPVDLHKAASLQAELTQLKYDLGVELEESFQPWWKPEGPAVDPKADRKLKCPELGTVTVDRVSEKTGKALKPYVGPVLMEFNEGSSYTKAKLVTFNPASRDHIADRLIKRYGWKPTEFGKDGKPSVTDDIISKLPYDEAKVIAEYLMVGKRLGQLSEGREAILKSVGKDGRLHGRVMSTGTVTGRCSHSKPNCAQFPSAKTREDSNGKKHLVFGREGGFGADFRDLFTAPKGMVMVGVDASGLELRCLAHYMHRYDQGEYADRLLNGDIHSFHAVKLGFEPEKLYRIKGRNATGRALAKTWIYAFLYGASDATLGEYISQGPKAAARLRASFLSALPALDTLTHRVKAKAKKAGNLTAIDGRKVKVRSTHAALNTLLQSCGGIVVKKATVLAHQSILSSGLEWGRDFANVAHVHDEIQYAAKETHSETIGRLAVASIRDAGRHYNFKCQLDGEFRVGPSWAYTH